MNEVFCYFSFCPCILCLSLSLLSLLIVSLDSSVILLHFPISIQYYPVPYNYGLRHNTIALAFFSLVFDPNSPHFRHFLSISSVGLLQKSSMRHKQGAQPKRKRVDTGVSSPPDSYKFWSSEARERYEKYFSHRPIRLEREVKIEEFQDTLIFHIFHSRGWLGLLRKPQFAAVNLVQEFYANIDKSIANGDGEESYTVFVRGKRIQFSPKEIRIFFELNNFSHPDFPHIDIDLNTLVSELYGEPCEWTGKALQQKKLTSFYRMLNRIVSHNIDPIGHTSTIPKERALFLYAIGRGQSIALDSHVFEVIRNAATAETKRVQLPFGCLITSILQNAGIVPLSYEKIEYPMQPISRQTLSRSDTHIRGDPTVIAEEESEGSEDEYVQEERIMPTISGCSSLETVTSHVQHLQEQLNDIQTRVDRGFIHLEERFDTLAASMNVFFSSFNPSASLSNGSKDKT